MDAVRQLNESLLSCSACSKRYTDPCTLGCRHTFCSSCLVEFMRTQRDAIQAKSLQCPRCREMTTVPEPEKPEEEWPKQMTSHFLIQVLLDETKLYVDNLEAPAIKALCFPCQHMGKTVQAGRWCKDCDVTLCEGCMKEHSDQHDTSDLVKVKVTEGLKTICQEHNNAVELCCKKCNKAVCTKCRDIYHSNCDPVVKVDSMVADMKSVVTNNRRGVTFAMEELQNHLSILQTKLNATGQRKADVQSEIKNASKKAGDLVQQQEKLLMDGLDEIIEKQTAELITRMKAFEIDVQLYQQYGEYLDEALSSESSMDLYDAYEICRSTVIRRSIQREYEKPGKSLLSQIIFIDKVDPETSELGRLKLRDNADLTGEPDLHDTIIVTSEDDQCTSRVIDVIVLDIEDIVTVIAVDEMSSCLRSFYNKDGQKCSSSLALSHQPWSLAKLKYDQLVGSFQSQKEFIIVKVTPELLMLSTVTTQKEYRCFTVVAPGTMAAFLEDTSSFDLLDLSGNILRSVTVSSEEDLIREPSFLCTTKKGNILVSDRSSEHVYCLTPEGEVVFTYKVRRYGVLGGPRGITTSPDGEILVLDSTEGKVIQLTEGGEYVRDLMRTPDVRRYLEEPSGICLHGDKLYISDLEHGMIQVICFQ